MAPCLAMVSWTIDGSFVGRWYWRSRTRPKARRRFDKIFPRDCPQRALLYEACLERWHFVGKELAEEIFELVCDPAPDAD